jgi:uncharacterized membrane protein
MWSKLTAYFLRGLFTLLPLLVTIWLILLIFNFLDGILGEIFTMVLGKHFLGLGFAVTVVIILFTGILMTHMLGEKLFKLGEAILYRVPIVKSIYASVSQVNDVLFMKKETREYRKACLVEYPSKGIYSIGFVTSQAAAEIEKKATGKKMVNIFIANTPTPATGFLIMVPASKIKLLNMRLDDAFRYVVSGGVLKPR